MKDQENNTSRNIRFTLNGETKSLKQWCEAFDMPYRTVHKRIHNLGWSFEEAIKTPIKTEYRNLPNKG